MHGVTKNPGVIFVVDDEAGVQTVMSRILERAGHEVHGCTSCEDVEALIASGVKPDLVITDVVLEGSTGNRVAALVRRDSPRTRVVFMSGYGNVAVPGHLVLHKPISARELVEIVDQVLSLGSGAFAIRETVLRKNPR